MQWDSCLTNSSTCHYFKIWRLSKCFFAHVRWAFKWLQLFHGYHFFPVSFWWWSHECWAYLRWSRSAVPQMFIWVLLRLPRGVDVSNFGRPITSGKNHYCSKFSPLGDNGSHCRVLESHNFRNSAEILFRWIYFKNILSLCSRISRVLCIVTALRLQTACKYTI